MTIAKRIFLFLTRPYFLPLASGGTEGRLLALALERLPEAVVLRDERQRIVFINAAAETLFGIRDEEVSGRMFEDLRTPETSRLRASLAFALEPHEEKRFVLFAQNRQLVFLVSEMAFPLWKNKRVFMRLWRDTTREEELSRLKTQFLSVAAHQLRNPIATLQWVMQIFLAGEIGPITDTQREMFQRATQTLVRMEVLISDLLDVTRMQEGRFQYDFKAEPELAAFVQRIVEEFRGRAQAKGIALSFQVPHTALPPMLIDTNRLRLAIENGLANALSYTPHGEITLLLERRGEYVVIVISDTGIGIPEAEQTKIFSKFFRASNAAQLGIDGTGLGLFIMRSIMRRHGGDAAIASQEGKGTTVTLTLPVDPSKVPSGDVPLEEVIV